MSRGRKPKPTHLKLLEGNPGRRPLPKNEPKPKPTAPKCPTWLDTEAKREWKRVAPEVEKLGLLTIVDGAALAAYCQGYSRMVTAEKAIKAHLKKHGKLTHTYVNKSGAANEVPIPEIKIAREAATQVRAFASEFGLTPSSRARLELPGIPNEEDEMEALLNGGG